MKMNDKNKAFYASLPWLALTVLVGWACQAAWVYPTEDSMTKGMVITLLAIVGVLGALMTNLHWQDWFREARDTFPTLSRASISRWAFSNVGVAILMAIIVGVTASTVLAILLGLPWRIGTALGILAAFFCGVGAYIALYSPPPEGPPGPTQIN